MLAGLVVLVVALVAAGTAVAKEPTGDFAAFKQCPRFTSSVDYCLSAQITGGEITIGGVRMPIVNPITFQGGYALSETTGAETFFGALNGETISRTPQPVPGGLLGMVKCGEIKNMIRRLICHIVFEGRLTALNATLELAAPASTIGLNTSNQLNQEGVALSLPVKIHLENPLLGKDCYIGSETTPLLLNLTTGTTSPPPPNKPITGKVGHIEFKDETELVELVGTNLVDNSFAVPAASGCGGPLSFLLDPLIDTKLGLPSPAGHNTAVQTATQKITSSEEVIAHEQ